MEAWKLQEKHLTENVNMATNGDDKDAEKAIKWILAMEQLCHAFHRLKTMMQGHHSGGLSHMLILDESGNIKSVYNAENMITHHRLQQST